MRQSETKKRNVIIGSLLGVLLLMAIGYAAFATQLNINGTASISSNWKILITNVKTQNIVGGASNAIDPKWDDLTATISTNLVSPGDSIEYEITVSNQGNMDAKLEKITKTDSNNPAIIYTVSGLSEGSILSAGSSATLTVKVEYSNSVTSQPENTSSDLSVTLDYVQNDGSGTVVPTPVSEIVYRDTKDTLKIGDSIEGIETTTDYNTLGKTFFLKHNVIDGVIESSEVCFIKDGLHCLVGGDSGAAYETNKALLLSVFGESACTVTDSRVGCGDGSLNARANDDGVVSANDAFVACGISAVGSAFCPGL